MNAHIRQQRDIVTGAEVEVGRRSLEKVSLQDGGGASSQTPKGQAALGSNRADGARDEAGKMGKDKKGSKKNTVIKKKATKWSTLTAKKAKKPVARR